MTNIYDKLCADGDSFNERNDCTVIATSITCDIPYQEAHKICKAAGRKNRGKLNTQAKLIPELENRGYNVTAIPTAYLFQENGCRYTMSTIGKEFSHGKYIVRIKGHVAALVDGKILDWTAGRRHRVLAMWQIIKTNSI